MLKLSMLKKHIYCVSHIICITYVFEFLVYVCLFECQPKLKSNVTTVMLTVYSFLVFSMFKHKTLVYAHSGKISTL